MFRQIPLILKSFLVILSSSFILACSGGGGGGSDGGGNGENPPINNYTVSFYDNGDILTQFNRNVAGGTQITLPTLTKANYTFDGWLLNGTGNPLTGSYTVNATTTFVAKWTATGPGVTEYTVSFYDNGVILPEYGTTAASGAQVTLPSPTKANHTFDGWLLNGTGNPLIGTYTVNANTTFTAKWTAIGVTEYTVSFYDNSVILPEYGRTVAGGSQIILPTPTKSNHTFDGWLLNGTGTPITGNYTVNANTAFTAKWTAISVTEYTVSFYDNGVILPAYGTTVASGTQITLPTPTKANYTFDGWLLNNAGSPLTGTYTVSANTTFTAKWTESEYTVSFYDNGVILPAYGRTVASGTQITLPTLTKIGHTFDGWLKDNDGSPLNGIYTVTEDVSFHAKWTALQFTVTYYDENGQLYSDIGGSVNYGNIVLPTKTKAGHTFDGWLKNNAGSPLKGTYAVTEDVSFHAKFTLAQFTVTYYDENGQLYSDVGGSVNYGNIVLPTKTKMGHTFDGWLKNNAGLPLNGTYTVTENVSFHAKWTALQYTVSYYDENGLTYNDIGGEAAYGDTITLPTRTNVGYAFDGWLIDNIGTPVTGQYTVTEDVSFHAKFTLQYTVSYYDENNQLYSDIGGLVNQGDTALPTRTKEGYIFDGWLVNGGGLPVTQYMIDSNISFYAQFTEAQYTVSYYDEYGRIYSDIGGETTYRYEDIITLPTREKTHYTFDGWLENNAGTPKNGTYTVTGDVTFYAKFTLPGAIPITSALELYQIRNNLSEKYILLNNITLVGYSSGWTPIGTESAPFTGILDGNGFKITDLYVNNSGVAGLFGYIGNDAVISNLTVEISASGVKGGSYAGGLAGRVDGTAENKVVISNVHIGGTGVVQAQMNTSSSSGASVYSGGISGYMDNVTLSDCSNTVNVTSSSSSTSTSTSSPSYYYSYSGGIAGYLTGGMTNSYNTGDVTSSSSHASSYASSSSYSGGIVGYLTGEMTNSYNTGDVTSSSKFYSRSGGIAGCLTSGTTITNSYNTGDITSSSTNSYSGGIAGYLAGGSTITNCYNIGNISSSSSSGGIVGYTNSDATITNCYNTGDVSSSGSSLYLGGIVGYAQGIAIISGNYSLGTISGNRSSGSSSIRIGGIAGYIANGTVTNNAAINPELKTTSSGSNIFFARIGNLNLTSPSLTVTNNFALDSMLATGGSFTADSAVNGIGKTEAELKTRVTYENAVNGNGFGGLGWQFGNDDDHPWKMPAGGTGFPILYWQ